MNIENLKKHAAFLRTLPEGRIDMKWWVFIDGARPMPWEV